MNAPLRPVVDTTPPEAAPDLAELLPLQGTRETGSLFSRWFQHLDPERCFTVLDLAGAQPATMQLLSGYRCKVYCADLLDDLCVPGKVSLSDAARLFDDRLAFIGEGVIDYCLLWDYPNYLPPPLLTVFARRLQRFLHVGSRMHLFAAMHGRSQLSPWRYSIERADTLIRKTVRRPLPDYPHTQMEVVDAMEYVRLDRGALRDGRVEVLLECV